MATATGARVYDLAAGLLLRSATVGDIVEHAGFRTIELTGERLVGVDWIPGDKARVRAGGGLTLRTYTPISWDPDRGATRFLAYTHGPGPGAEWCRNAQPGDACQVRGPDRSVRLDRLTAPPVFVGDETSFGLLLAFRAQRPEMNPAASLFEVTDVDASRATLHDHGTVATDLVPRSPGEAHRDSFAQLVLDTARAHPDAPLCLTGRAQTIAAIRRLLKADGQTRAGTIVKAYWDENRKGLD